MEEHPVRIQRTPGDDVYWFDWDSSFEGKATIRITKLGSEAMVFRIYRALLEARFGQAEIYVRSYRVSGVTRFGQLA